MGHVDLIQTMYVLCAVEKINVLFCSVLYTSLIDYICIPCDNIDFVTHCEIADDNCLNVSRHRPILCCLSISIHPVETVGNMKQCFNWKRISNVHVLKYCESLNNATCNHALDDQDIDQTYDLLCKIMRDCAEQNFPVKKRSRHQKPFWSDELVRLHDVMSQSRDAWCRAGRPRGARYREYETYKAEKAIFRRRMRQCAEDFLKDVDCKLEYEAVHDVDRFWQSVKARRQGSTTKVGDGLNFNGTVYRSREDIVTQWGSYFKDLYTPSESKDFDEPWRLMVEESVDRAFNNLVIDTDVTVQSTLVTECIRTLPKGKACGPDGITHEHLLYGCSVISTPLAGLYTQVIRSGYIPDKMKEGEIITLHKGGRKSKSDPNNYRAITLSSSILKVYEMIL